jgi:diphthamide synthase (EF-2-diphthine--ammonia ligase)
MAAPAPILLSWSTGKDCSWALHVLQSDAALSQQYRVVGLLTTFNEANSRVAMHGTRAAVAAAQSRALGLPLWRVDLPSPCPNDTYAQRMRLLFSEARARGIAAIAYGDLWLADVRAYREATHAGTGIAPLFPIWLGSEGGEGACAARSAALAARMLAAGLRARLVTVDTRQLPAALCGREFDAELLAALAAAGADACGERGEFHSVAYAGPAFGGTPLALRTPAGAGSLVERGQFVYSDFEVAPGGGEGAAAKEAGEGGAPGGLLLDAAAFAARRDEALGSDWERAAALAEALCPSAPPTPAAVPAGPGP